MEGDGEKRDEHSEMEAAVAAARAAAEALTAACERVAALARDEVVARELRGVSGGAAAHVTRLLQRAAHSTGTTTTPGAAASAAASAAAVRSHDVVAAAAAYRVEQRAIGVVRSPYRELNGTPRQATLAAAVPGEIALFGHVQPQHALAGLEQYSHVWVVAMFHGNTNVTYHPRVAPPLMDGARTGVFGSRSPHRPNAIALSLCRVEAVDRAAGVVRVRGIDLIDGTPVLDLKPYVPADIVPDARCPPWLAARRIDHVVWTPAALEQLDAIYQEHQEPQQEEKGQEEGQDSKKARKRARREERRTGRRIVRSAGEARAVVEQMLRLDVRSVHAKAKHAHKEYGVTLDDVGFLYAVDDDTRTSTVFAVNHYDPLLKAVAPPPRTVPYPAAAAKAAQEQQEQQQQEQQQ